MDKEHFTKLLIEQQEKGKLLLSLVSSMHESQNDFGDGMAMFGGEDLYYVPEDELDGFLNKFEGWRSYMSDLLKTQFGVDDQFVYDWNSKFIPDVVACFYKVFGKRCNLVIYLVTGLIYIRINAVKKADAHGNGTDIEIFLLDHFIGFGNFHSVDHN